MVRAILFDLDETLVAEEAVAHASFAAAARVAAQREDIDPEILADDARAHARRLWYGTSQHDWCLRVGISSWEGLWCRFEGDLPELQALRAWAPEFRRSTWNAGLLEQGVVDSQLAEELSTIYEREQRAAKRVFPEVESELRKLASDYSLALVTNGASCLQREKLQSADLEKYFETVVVSADIGYGKPDRRIFEVALTEMNVAPHEALMVGDSPTKDIEGAKAMGIHAMRIERGVPQEGAGADPRIQNLRMLSAELDRCFSRT